MNSKPLNFKFELSIRSIKMLDIAVMFAISSIIGYTFGQLISKVYVFDIHNKKHTSAYKNTTFGKTKLIIHILLVIMLTGIIAYIARQIIQLIPWPFDGYMGINPPSNFKGYNHKLNIESKNPFPLMFFIMYYNHSLKNRIAYLQKLMK